MRYILLPLVPVFLVVPALGRGHCLTPHLAQHARPHFHPEHLTPWDDDDSSSHSEEDHEDAMPLPELTSSCQDSAANWIDFYEPGISPLCLHGLSGSTPVSQSHPAALVPALATYLEFGRLRL